MSSASADQPLSDAPVGRWRVGRWPIWEVPQKLLTAVVTVEVTALSAVIAATVGQGVPSPTQWGVLALLVAMGLLHTEAVVHSERTRRRLAIPHHIDLSSVWIFAAALVLPPVLTAGLVLVLQVHIWWRTGRPRIPYFKNLFTTATLVLASVGAHGVTVHITGSGVLDSSIDLIGIVLAMLVFTTINGALVGGAIAMSSADASLSTLIGGWDDNLLELATLCLGALLVVVLPLSPWLAPFLFPPVLVLHRSVLVRHLKVVADTDGKTGLLNAAAWHTEAEKELRRARRREVPRAVLVVDLDHFKEVNDRHGHLAGDCVLAAVARALRAEVRERDLVGRFGGEEFVVLLAGGPTGDGSTAELTAVAERIRLRIAALRVEMPTPDGPLTVTGLSASVGAAFFPDHGTELRELLQVADTALYAAKRAGRNAVRAGVQAPRPVPLDRVDTAETR